MPHRRDYAVFEHELNEFVRMFDFRSEGHEFDTSASGGDERRGKDGIEGTDAVATLGSGFFRIDERTFDMNSRGVCAVMLLFDHVGENIDCFEHIRLRRCGHGREKSSDAVRCESERHLVHQGIVVDESAGGVESAGAVYMTVDESGNGIGIFHFDDFETGFPDERRRSARSDDFIPVAKDCAGRDIFMRSQTMIRKE